MERKHALPNRGIARAIGVLCLLAGLLGLPARGPVQAARLAQAPLSIGKSFSVDGGVAGGAVAWGDYDNDNDLDLLATGRAIDGPSTILYTNTGTTLVENTSVHFQDVESSSVDWGDYDNDGYLDVLLTGLVHSASTVTAFSGVYHNVASGSGRGFTLLPLNLPPVYQGAGVWADYNNDGRLDFMITGTGESGAPVAVLYRNTSNTSGAGSFATTLLTPLGDSAAAWGDFDRDGYADLVYSGRNAGGTPTTLIYRNNRSGGLYPPANLPGMYRGTVNFIDYNSNGALDLLLTGNTSANGTNVPVTRLYRYASATPPYFQLVTGTNLPDIWESSVSVGDFNNDGAPDLALNGITGTQRLTRIYAYQQNGAFSDTGASLPNEAGLSLAWGDFDSDRILDLVLTGVPGGVPGSEKFTTDLYHNAPAAGNAAPAMPTLNSACWNTVDRLYLDWSNTSDDHTGISALQYGLRIGTTPGGSEIKSAQADPATGFRRTAEMGNAFNVGSTITGTHATLFNLPGGNYYWSVQSVDSTYTGGPFANSSGKVINLGQRVAEDDTYDLEDNAPSVTLDVLRNDNPDGGALILGDFSNATHGDLSVQNNQFVYKPRAPYEGVDSFYYYAVRDNTRYCSRGLVTLHITQHNDPPTGITLSNDEVPDGAPANTLVGQFSTTDPDLDNTFTYSLVPLNGSNLDNASFSITGDLLYIKVAAKVSVKPGYTIRVRSTDKGGLWTEASFNIIVTGNHAPTGVFLDKNEVKENQPVNTVIGTLTASDGDPGEAFTYALVAENGNNYDNASFKITGDQLLTNAVFVYNVKSSYTIRVRVTDRGGLSVAKNFPINIIRTQPRIQWQNASGSWLDSGPALVTMSEDGLTSLGQPDPFVLNLKGLDDGNDEILTWSIAAQAKHGTASVSGTTANNLPKAIQYKPATNWNSGSPVVPDSFQVKVRDPGGNFSVITVKVTVNAVNDAPRFDLIPGQVYLENTGVHTIQVTGISAGAANETEQVGFALYGYQAANPILTKFSVQPNLVSPGTTVLISMTVGAGSGDFNLRLIALDGQQYNNVASQVFKVSVRRRSDFTLNFYLPLIGRH